MTGYESKRAAARDKLVDDRRAYYEKFDDLYAVYLNGVYDGKKAAAQEPTKYSFKAHWEADGCIGVVAAIERLDGGVHLLKDIIDAPQRPWVGLTDDERNEIASVTFGRENALALYVDAIEAKLKEKNG
jgi:hypothetical protein